ncbi:hypothetical protein TSUD_157430 [Trifolium subterraneum]|uniref:Uncharacterized protein n=1 Tax=Trifolium subterraneum TaxID=3900 RepID=A0A2Z6N095_TRISU|nr:hypothetical protein TSUD_157430 [Trifolium subterraneum]
MLERGYCGATVEHLVRRQSDHNPLSVADPRSPMLRGSDGKGLHMVSWKRMIKHKNGGLGVRMVRHQNTHTQFFVWPVFKVARPTRAVLKGWACQFQIFPSRSNGVVVDGSVLTDSGLAGFGRLVRDQTGHLQGFCGSLDYLAKMGVNCGMRLRVMQEIPPDLSSILLADSLGVSSPRPSFSFWLYFFSQDIFIRILKSSASEYKLKPTNTQRLLTTPIGLSAKNLVSLKQDLRIKSCEWKTK